VKSLPVGLFVWENVWYFFCLRFYTLLTIVMLEDHIYKRMSGSLILYVVLGSHSRLGFSSDIIHTISILSLLSHNRIQGILIS